MAVLRDKVTSAPLFEGSAVEAVLVADQLGRDEVIFDDVGAEFDPDAVITAHDENISTAQATLSSSDADADDKERAQATVDSAPSVDDVVPAAQDALTEARARVGE
jgi:hypothetical protein